MCSCKKNPLPSVWEMSSISCIFSVYKSLVQVQITNKKSRSYAKERVHLNQVGALYSCEKWVPFGSIHLFPYSHSRHTTGFRHLHSHNLSCVLFRFLYRLSRHRTENPRRFSSEGSRVFNWGRHLHWLWKWFSKGNVCLTAVGVLCAIMSTPLQKGFYSHG